MANIQLLVTGRMEQLGLPQALAKWLLAAGAGPVTFAQPEYLTGFTSASLGPSLPDYTPGDPDPPAAYQFAASIIQRGLDCRSKDFVIAIDDAESVAGQTIAAGHSHLSFYLQILMGRSTQKELAHLRRSTSFHFVVPMAEAWLFPDLAALGTAGSKHGHGQWNPQTDAEQFQVTDDAYLAWLQTQASGWRSGSPLNPSQHPKWYLKYLCQPDNYKETKGGAGALATLNPALVPQPSPHMAYLHALLDDLADMAGAHYPPGVPAGTLTQRIPGGLLRNLR